MRSAIQVILLSVFYGGIFSPNVWCTKIGFNLSWAFNCSSYIVSTVFLKMGQPWPPLIYFLSCQSNNTFLQQINVKNVYPVLNAGICTDNLSI